MSRTKTMARGAMAAGAMIAAVAGVVWMFPLAAEAQMLPDGPGVKVDAGAPLWHRTPVFRPSGVSGIVVADLSVNAKGEVMDVRVVSGPEELRRVVIANALNWHYAAPALPTVRASVTFADPETQTLAAAPPPPPTAGTERSGVRVVVPPPPPPPPPPAPGTRISSITYRNMSADLEQRIQQEVNLRVGDGLPAADTLRSKLGEIDPHLSFFLRGAAEGSVAVVFHVGTDVGTYPAPVQPPENTARVSREAASGMVTTRTSPLYPPIARQARVQGTVTLSVIVDAGGRVEQIATISGPAMLRQSAMDAVRQWTFTPLRLNGTPVPFLTEIEVNFALL